MLEPVGVLGCQQSELSMERTEDAASGPLDRIGQLTMRHLEIADAARPTGPSHER